MVQKHSNDRSSDETEKNVDGDHYDLDVDLDVDADPDTDEIMREALAAVSRRRGEGAASTDAENAPIDTAADDAEHAETAEDEMARVKAELEELKERSLRTLADYENYRRRVVREKAQSRREAEMGPLRELLPVIDNLERALAAQGGVEELKLGVDLIKRQLLELVSRFGVEPLPPSEGQPFDPTKHEAILRQEDPAVEVPMVSAEVQRGYLVGDRLLRPSMVHVAVPVGEGGLGDRAADQSDSEADA